MRDAPGTPLTERQQAILELMADGLRLREIGRVLGLDPLVVRQSASRAYHRLGVAGQPRPGEAAVRLIRQERRPPLAPVDPPAEPRRPAPAVAARPCDHCGKPVTKRPDTLHQKPHVFCDRACYEAWRAAQPKPRKRHPRQRPPEPVAVPPPPEAYPGTTRPNLREQLKARRRAERAARGWLDDAAYLAQLGG